MTRMAVPSLTIATLTQMRYGSKCGALLCPFSVATSLTPLARTPRSLLLLRITSTTFRFTFSLIVVGWGCRVFAHPSNAAFEERCCDNPRT